MRSCVPAVTIQMSEKIMLGQPLTLTPRHTRHEPTENSTPRSQVHNSSPVTENKLTGRSLLSCIASVFNADSTLEADICDTGIEMKHKSQIIWGLQQGTPDENELLAISGTICVLCIVSNKTKLNILFQFSVYGLRQSVSAHCYTYTDYLQLAYCYASFLYVSFL